MVPVSGGCLRSNICISSEKYQSDLRSSCHLKEDRQFCTSPSRTKPQNLCTLNRVRGIGTQPRPWTGEGCANRCERDCLCFIFWYQSIKKRHRLITVIVAAATLRSIHPKQNVALKLRLPVHHTRKLRIISYNVLGAFLRFFAWSS